MLAVFVQPPGAFPRRDGIEPRLRQAWQRPLRVWEFNEDDRWDLREPLGSVFHCADFSLGHPRMDEASATTKKPLRKILAVVSGIGTL